MSILVLLGAGDSHSGSDQSINGHLQYKLSHWTSSKSSLAADSDEGRTLIPKGTWTAFRAESERSAAGNLIRAEPGYKSLTAKIGLVTGIPPLHSGFPANDHTAALPLTRSQRILSTG
jgi:hypothetical protein